MTPRGSAIPILLGVSLIGASALHSAPARNPASPAGVKQAAGNSAYAGTDATAAELGQLVEKEWEQQYAFLLARMAAGGPKGEMQSPVASQTFHAASLIQPEDRDPVDVALRQTGEMLKARQAVGSKAAESFAKEYTALAAEIRGALPQPVPAAEKPAGKGKGEKALQAAPISSPRYAQYLKLCRLRRRIALANPLLDFKSILFIKRNGLGREHMCDQYYGQDQQPGGGVYILSDPFGPAPALRNVLADATVANGRLKGQKLTAAGSFLSPALSYDARRIAFAYVECSGPRKHEQHTDPTRGHWPEGWSYHVFSANLDGTDLRMLTDGTWNDFSPCFMPSGRVAFITERRGGYLRCGRVCPTYTLFDMAPDGSDIRCLSYHETNEWSPSVTHDGMILWTRWDYVDRHGCVTHMPWITTPDGRDPRPVHGNYAPRNQRADMELDARPIPGSRRFVATGAPHHGFAFGTLVVIDPQVRDDDAMAPVKRLTPEVAFPESQGNRHPPAAYGQAWPLGETDYLGVYRNKHAETYALYLLDAFGNKELLYRDPSLHALSPVPVRPQPVPPVLPELPRSSPAKSDEAIVGVLDVYESLKSWPKESKITALRIYQIFPLSLPSAAVFGRHETGLRIPQAADSINLTRAALGTVPVEADGSAHFVVPARKELYFQALDAQGLAVTSMRSGTHFLPGERAMCQGCHEPKHRSPPATGLSTRLALRRPPSRIQPEVEGSNPISYPRLVQPVLDANCVACHAKNAGKAPPLDRSLTKIGNTEYFASYKSLAQKYGFYSYPDYHRTTPGQFGARASKLYELLQKGHHDVKLPAEPMRRITLWLDSVSVFYGVYEPEGQMVELSGRLARPTLE